MNHSGNDQPPGWILAFFRWFCHPEYTEDIEGDLLERFYDRIAKMGLRKAKWLLIKDVLLLFKSGMIRDLKDQSQLKISKMKSIPSIKLISLHLLIVLMIVSPFIPGPSNKIVKLFSVAGQLTGVMGLFLMPIGLAWTIIQIRNLNRGNERIVKHKLHYRVAITATLLVAFILLLCVLLVPNPMPKMTFAFGLLLLTGGLVLAFTRIKKWQNTNESIPDHGALIILASSATACVTLMYIFYLLFVFFEAGPIPTILGILLLPVGLIWINKQIRKLKGESKFNIVPICLVTMPLIAFLTFKFMMEPVSNFSRNFAIKRSEALIASIEDHKARTGQYPGSIQELYLHSLKKTPKPFIMGIEDFRYNKINDYYSLSFSQWLHVGSLEEIVLYDKNNLKNNLTGDFAKYNYKFDLCRVKGAFASHNTRYDNWRYYHCD